MNDVVRPGRERSALARMLGRGLRAQRGVRLTMHTLREAAGKTQAEVAVASRMDQADVSRLERRETFADCQVSTLERYVAALGGRLDLVATFGDKRIILAGAEPGSAAAGPPRANSGGRNMQGNARLIRRVVRWAR
jgi:transcriptional regulator with XRE-family HTH domain